MSVFGENWSSCPDTSVNTRIVERTEKGSRTMELFIPIVILVAWIVLQAWVLPRFGVHT